MSNEQLKPQRDEREVIEWALRTLTALDAEVVDRCPGADCEACRPSLDVAA